MYSRLLSNKFDCVPEIHYSFEANILKKSVSGKKVLDIGCWIGQFFSFLDNFVVGGYRGKGSYQIRIYAVQK